MPVTRGVLVPCKATGIQCYSLYLLLKYATWCSLFETVQGSSAFSAILWWGKGPKLAPKYASDNDQCRAVDGWSMPLQDLSDGGLQIVMFLCSPKPWHKLERILKILCKVNTCLFLRNRNQWTILKAIYNQPTSADIRERGNSAYIMHTRVVYSHIQISHVQCLKLEWRINVDHREATWKETKLIKVKVQTRNESGKSLETYKKS